MYKKISYFLSKLQKYFIFYFDTCLVITERSLKKSSHFNGIRKGPKNVNVWSSTSPRWPPPPMLKSGLLIAIFFYYCFSTKSYHLRQLYSVPFRSSVPFRNCCKLLALPISPDIMDGFWCSRCLNDRIEVPKMMGSFLGGSTTPLVVKNGTKQTCWKWGFF